MVTNFGTIEDYLDDDYYKWRFGPNAWVSLLNGATVGRVGTGTHSALIFPKNGLISAGFTERSKPQFWKYGNLRFTLYYTGDTASVNNFVVGGTVSAVAVGANLNVAGQTLTGVAIPGPAVAYAEKSFTFSDLVPVNAGHRMIGLKPTRMSANASDTNAGNLLVLELLVEYVPAGGH